MSLILGLKTVVAIWQYLRMSYIAILKFILFKNDNALWKLYEVTNALQERTRMFYTEIVAVPTMGSFDIFDVL